jgi:hypothetical protein
VRRNFLIALNSLYLLFAGLIVGVPIAVGAIVAPIMFHAPDVNRGAAGAVMSKAFEGAGLLSIVLLSIMLGVAVFETNYRKRANTKRLLVARVVVNLLALLLSVYMAKQVLPMIREFQVSGPRSTFEGLHAYYKQLQWLAITLGVALNVLTQAVNIGPRRDGGHSRQV